jgi:hypothetical protein
MPTVGVSKSLTRSDWRITDSDDDEMLATTRKITNPLPLVP